MTTFVYSKNWAVYCIVLTYNICSTKRSHFTVIHIVVVTQFQLHQVNLNFTMLDKHAMLHNLPVNGRLSLNDPIQVNQFIPSFNWQENII